MSRVCFFLFCSVRSQEDKNNRWGFDCGKSRDRFSGKEAAFNASNASHEHECIAWRKDKFDFRNSSSVRGRNDSFGIKNCHYDFTAHAVDLFSLQDGEIIRFVAVHDDSQVENCRIYENVEYWDRYFLDDVRVILAGDWNAGMTCIKDVCENSTDQLKIPLDKKVQTHYLGERFMRVCFFS